MYIVQYITVHVLDRKPELVQAVQGEGNYDYVHCYSTLKIKKFSTLRFPKKKMHIAIL